MPTWPASLPQSPDTDGYEEKPQSRVLRSTMDAGPPKTRRRFTAGTRAIPVRFTLLSQTELEAFETFFEDEILDGSLAFDWPQPRTGETVSVLIVGDPPYTISSMGGALWELAFNIEVQP